MTEVANLKAWEEVAVTRMVNGGLKDLLIQVGTEKTEGAPTRETWICSGSCMSLIWAAA